MKTIYLRGEVETAIKSTWDDFAREHPQIAAALDREVLIEEATQSLRNDVEFNKALQDAQAAGWAGGLVSGVVREFVAAWLKRLL